MKCGDCKREYDALGHPLSCSQDWDGKTWLCRKCESERVSQRNSGTRWRCTKCGKEFEGNPRYCPFCGYTVYERVNIEQPVVSEPDWEALARVYKKREFKLAVEHKRLRESMHRVAAESDQFGLDPKLDDKPWDRLGLIHGIARHALEGESVTPRYQHDCNHCIFVGRGKVFHGPEDQPIDDQVTTKVDVYICPQQGVPTIVARYSDDGPDYMSGQRLLEKIALEEF